MTPHLPLPAVLRRVTAALLVALVATVVSGAAVPTPAAAACTNGSKVIGGTFVGSDGRSVSGMVGLAVYDAAGQPIGPDGCPLPISGYGSYIDLVNPHPSNPGCCFALPTEGASPGTGETTWRVAVPNNAATVWVEAYPKSNTPSDYNGQPHQTDYRRYGGAMHRNVPASGTNIDIRLPLNCASGGRTAQISGDVTRGGQPVALYSVVAFSRAAEGTGQTLGFMSTPYVNGGGFHLVSLAPDQSYAIEFRTTDGGHYWFEHDYGAGIPVAGCGTVYRSFALHPDGRATATNGITSGPTAAATGSGNPRLFYRGGDGGLWTTIDASGAPAALGGGLIGEPDAAAMGPSRIDVVARGTDNAVWWRSSSNGTFGGWTSLGGGTVFPPAIVSWGPGRLDVVATGLDGQVWLRSSADGGASWFGWTPLGGYATAGPDITSWGPNRLDIAARGGDGALWHRAWSSGWLPWESLGGQIVDGPSVAAGGFNDVEFTARGTDNRIFTLRWKGGWQPWAPVGGGLTDAAPEIVSHAGFMWIYARGLDGSIWRAMRTAPNGSYGGWIIVAN